MIRLRITIAKKSLKELLPSLPVVFNSNQVLVESSPPWVDQLDPAGNRFLVWGDVSAYRFLKGSRSVAMGSEINFQLFHNPQSADRLEGRFIVLKVSADNICEIWTDKFGRVDLYWQTLPDRTVIGTQLDLLPVSANGGSLCNTGVAHALTVYGSRPAKQHSVYRDVRRLGVGQSFVIKGTQLEIQNRSLPIHEVSQYTDNDHHRYADLLLSAIESRASMNGNVVSLSSGWDSTAILGCLVHLFGANKVTAITGRMKYSDRSGVINQFEIDRAQAMADYYGVKLRIVDSDYRSFSEDNFHEIQGYLRSNQLPTITAISQFNIAREVGTKQLGEVLFTGEASDGAHNLGFSQFVSWFHPTSQAFREYADKMSSYLFGPSFYSEILNNTFEKDPIWQLIRGRSPSTKLEARRTDELGLNEQFLASFFIRNSRLPFSSMENADLLTPLGREAFDESSKSTYLKEFSGSLNSKTLYSVLLNLYHSFHWQSAQVVSRDYAADANGVRVAHPFLDSGVLEFLSSMPETWGRGLDFNNTKYPLKWMLRNKIDYPYHLQSGPHSYTYDVNPDFTLLGEILFASSLKGVFQKSLRLGSFVSALDNKYFDLNRIKYLSDRYLKGEELKGKDQAELGVLAMHSAVGIYGQ